MEIEHGDVNIAFIYCEHSKRTMRHHFKLSAIPVDTPLDADLVDMPPFDDLWSSRRFVHDTISGEPQTSLNARPRNIPRNAELMKPLQSPLWSRRRKPQHDRDDYDGSFPWREMQYRKSHTAEPQSHHIKSVMNTMKGIIVRGQRMDMLLELLLLLNVALILYIILRLL